VARLFFAIESIMKTSLLWANRAIGAMDASTGLLLMTVPQLTLSLMRLPALAEPSLVYLSWIGAFVFAIGLSYFLVGKNTHPERTKMMWQITALARAVIAIFVTIQIVMGQLALGWLTVALTDAAVAAVQLWGLRNFWWRA
jgi:hypothetical protein